LFLLDIAVTCCYLYDKLPVTVRLYVDTPKDAEFAARLKECMRRGKIRSNTLAAELKVTPKAVSYWRTGVKKPRANTLEDLARIFKVSVAWLAYGEGPAQVEGTGQGAVLPTAGSPLIEAIRATLETVSALGPREGELLPILQALVALRETCENRR
jgi:transcriptional regulator with XRE-family HTH domain